MFYLVLFLCRLASAQEMSQQPAPSPVIESSFVYYVFLVLLLFVVGVLIKVIRDYNKLRSKYLPLINLEEEIEKNNKNLQSLRQETIESANRLSEIKTTLDVFEIKNDLVMSGFYESKYDFKDAAGYKIKLDSIRERQKELIKSKNAIVCTTTWTVSGSEKEGEKMINKIISLGLAAFNVQCDNEILKVTFSNINKTEQKIRKIKENVNKLLERNSCYVSESFFNLKLEELYLAHEYQEKLEKEKEEQRLIREQMKEEERERRELEKIKEEAEKEEQRYEKALEQARRDLEKYKDEKKELYLSKIQELEAKLAAAQEAKERAKAQAELTKRGHVYIISNLGSFGENVYKIGMTRRLEPMDRVKELGDASVPFQFDVHAMIFSENAPELERKLHLAFSNKRLNQVNERKEFFRVSLDEIEKQCRELCDGTFVITRIAEAKEYNLTLAKLNNSHIS